MLLVDAYNVLHCSHVLPDRYAMVGPAGLCDLIRQSGMGAGGAAVVCDGVRKPHEAADEGEGGVEVIYAGRGRDADTLLEQMIARDTGPRQLVVVSNDRRIRRAARRRKARVLHSETFLKQLATRLRRLTRPPQPSEKPTTPDTEAWLKKFALDDPSTDEARDEGEGEDESETRYWLRVFGYERE